MRRILMTVAVVLLVAAACGGDDSGSLADAIDAQDSGSDGGSSDDDSSDSSSDDAADDGGDDGGDDDEPGDFGAGSSSDFCNFNEDIESGLDDLDIFGEVDGVRNAFAQLRDNIDQAVGLAPSEIRDDVALLSEGIEAFVEVLEDYDYDFFAIPEDDPRLAALEDPQFDAASDRVNAFCGFDDTDDFDSSGDGDDVPDLGIPDDEARAIVIQGLQTAFGWDAELASCVVDELGLDDPSSIDSSVFGDPTAEVCGQSIAELFGG